MPVLSPEELQKINIGQLEDLEEEIIKLQKIEGVIESQRGATQKTIDKYATNPVLYTQVGKIEELLKESEELLKYIVEKGNVRGRVLAKKGMDRYLKEAERANRTQRMLDIIERSNEKSLRRRIDLYLTELEKEGNILKSDIAIFKRNARASGLSSKEAAKRLVRAARDKSGPVQGFAKRLKSLETAALRREAARAEIDEYKKLAKRDEKWQWVTISVKPCPDCSIRAGKVEPYHVWVYLGIPGAGMTICGSHCKCKLVPFSVAEGLYPDVKEFRFDKNSGVLTTRGTIRRMQAEKAKAPQNKGK